jgi:hypothetical protein
VARPWLGLAAGGMVSMLTKFDIAFVIGPFQSKETL